MVYNLFMSVQADVPLKWRNRQRDEVLFFPYQEAEVISDTTTCNTDVELGNVCQHMRQDFPYIVTKIKKNMKNSLVKLHGKLILRKRSIIETVSYEMKNVCQIENYFMSKRINILTVRF